MAFKRFFAAMLTDLEEGRSYKVLGPQEEPYLLLKKEEAIYAIQATCPHEGMPLDGGQIEGSTITCPWHGWEFDLITGRCINPYYGDSIGVKVEVDKGKVYLLLDYL